MTIMRISKEENRSLRWVAKAASTDSDRAVLQGLNISDDAVIACDGYRLHAVAPMPSAPARPNGPVTLNFGKIPATATIVEPEVVEGRYPDVKQIVPNATTTEPDTVICFNPQYLREALAGMEGMVELRVRVGHPVELLGHKNGEARYALIMAMHNGADYSGAEDAAYWRPGD